MGKKNLVSLAFVFLTVTTFAQTTVSLVVSGEGPTKTEATSTALRSAIEQAFGTFVSANTTILNDELVEDEIATVSSGNIESYEEVSSFEVDGLYNVTVKATVSIDKLVSYVQGKGARTEFAGQAFGMQMKMRKLNKANEEQVLKNLVKQVTIFTSNVSLYDYKIEQNEPQYVDGQKYRVPFTVYATPNENQSALYSLVLNTFKSIALTEMEQSSYNDNKYPINKCMPLAVAEIADEFCLRSDKDFLNGIEQSIRKDIKLNLHCFSVVRIGEGEESKAFFVPVSWGNLSSKLSFNLSPLISEDILYVTSDFEVVPNLELRKERQEFIDLGLSVKWGTMNLLQCQLAPYGDYCNWDDAMSAIIANDGRVPTAEEWMELKGRCSWEWVSEQDMSGFKVTGPSGKSIFLPAAGVPSHGFGNGLGKKGGYWSSSIQRFNSNSFCYNIFYMKIENDYSQYIGILEDLAIREYSVRPVKD